MLRFQENGLYLRIEIKSLCCYGNIDFFYLSSVKILLKLGRKACEGVEVFHPCFY